MALVSISRQFGAGGRTLGKMLAEELGYEFLDEIALDLLAQKAQVWLADSQTEPSSVSQRLIEAFPQVHTANYLERFLDQDKRSSQEISAHFEDLARVIQQLAEIGNLVLLGRGSQFILEHDPKVLKVLMVADMESRVSFLTEAYRLNTQQAKRMIQQADKERAKVMSRFRPDEEHEATVYHMVLNTSLLSLESAKALLIKAVYALEAKL